MATTGEDIQDIEDVVRLRRKDGSFITVRASLVAGERVGPGLRPRHEEVLMIRNVGDDQVLIISTEPERPLQAVVVGDGGRPVADI